MKIRNATEKDKEGIAVVLKESYNIDSVEEGAQVFEHETTKKEYHYIVAVDGGKIIGLTTWQLHGLPKHGLCELDRIAVLPEAQGKGVAKQLIVALVKAAEDEYKKHGHKLRKIYILTHASNKRAQAFYEKMRWKHETTLKDHYYENEDEFVYARFF